MNGKCCQEKQCLVTCAEWWPLEKVAAKSNCPADIQVLSWVTFIFTETKHDMLSSVPVKQKWENPELEWKAAAAAAACVMTYINGLLQVLICLQRAFFFPLCHQVIWSQTQTTTTLATLRVKTATSSPPPALPPCCPRVPADPPSLFQWHLAHTTTDCTCHQTTPLTSSPRSPTPLRLLRRQRHAATGPRILRLHLHENCCSSSPTLQWRGARAMSHNSPTALRSQPQTSGFSNGNSSCLFAHRSIREPLKFIDQITQKPGVIIYIGVKNVFEWVMEKPLSFNSPGSWIHLVLSPEKR